jgi:outer membrane protein W
MLAVALPISALAQTTGEGDVGSLRGRHTIELTVGILSDVGVSNEISIGHATMTSEANGLIGSLGYSYWFANEWAINLSVGVANADVSTSMTGSNFSVESAVVIPLHVGVKYEPLGLAIGGALRPYFLASLGPYFGFASDVRTGATTGAESYSETAIGARAAAGLDVSLAERFTLGFALGYRLVSDFGRRIGSEMNHSSPEVSLSLGVTLGSGRK